MWRDQTANQAYNMLKSKSSSPSLAYILTLISRFQETSSLTSYWETYSGYFSVFISTLLRCFVRVHIRLKNGFVPLYFNVYMVHIGLEITMSTNQYTVHTYTVHIFISIAVTRRLSTHKTGMYNLCLLITLNREGAAVCIV